MVEEDEVVVLESVGGVDEDIHELNENLTINLLDVEIVHL
jgi:ATP-dependent 26S proteasome regulatory subunit